MKKSKYVLTRCEGGYWDFVILRGNTVRWTEDMRKATIFPTRKEVNHAISAIEILESYAVRYTPNSPKIEWFYIAEDYEEDN